jgi:hypothetical protein
MNEEKTVVLTMNIRYKQGYTGVLVGQCRELPFIIVEGKSVEELTKNVFYEIQVYFNTFPTEGKKILEQYGRIVETEEAKQQTSQDTEQGWTEKKIEVPIPISR